MNVKRAVYLIVCLLLFLIYAHTEHKEQKYRKQIAAESRNK